MGDLYELFNRLGPARVGAIALTGLLVMGFFIFMMFRTTTPEMALLYGELEPEATRNMATKLADMKIAFDLRQNNTQVWVPKNRVSELRLSLAGEGLSGSVLGYEIFDRDASLGQSNLVQEVNRLRAMEGELARTLSGLEQVRSARVHIVLPRRELFTRDKESPSATVMLKMKGADRFGKSEITAIQHMVATAVPSLRPDHITIVDNHGVLLHAGGEVDGVTASFTSSEEMRSGFEKSLAASVTSLLEQSLGYGKVKVEVRAEMDFSQIIVNTENFDPNQQVARSTENINELSKSTDGVDSTVTVNNNLPNNGGAQTGSSGPTENNNRSEERVNFEIGKTQTNRVRPPGTLEKLSVAVLVDGSYSQDDKGQSLYTPRSDEEMKKLTELVRSAVGYNQTRGDVVELVNMQFADNVPPVLPSPILYFGYDIADLKRLGETIGVGLVFLLIMFLVVRPMVVRIMEFRATFDEEKMEPSTRLMVDQYGRVIHVPQTAEQQEGGAGVGAAGADLDSLIDVANVEGQLKASTFRRIGDLIEKHPNEAVAIIRNWLYND